MKPRKGESIQQFLLRMQRRQAWGVVLVPALGVLLLPLHFHANAVTIGLFVSLYVLSMLGITAGFHRMLAHRSFKASTLVRSTFVVLGCLAAEGPPSFWVATHRKHHRFSDQADDPHSPRKSFWHSHVGWMFTELPTDPLKYAPDILSDKATMAIQRRYPWIVVAGVVTPGVIAALCLGPAGFVDGVLWGGLLRLFAVQHVTWSINSFCHLFGSRPWDTREDSRNNAIFGLLALGEGWHNNHHAAPRSAAHGWSALQPDVSYWTIRALERLGLVDNVILADAGRVGERIGRAVSEDSA